jgi:hypothetical protein
MENLTEIYISLIIINVIAFIIGGLILKEIFQPHKSNRYLKAQTKILIELAKKENINKEVLDQIISEITKK